LWSGASESTAMAEARGRDPVLDRQEDCLNKELDIPVRGPGVILDQDIRDREAILVQVLDILDKQGVLKVAILDKQGVIKVAILDKQGVIKVAILDKQGVIKVAILDKKGVPKVAIPAIQEQVALRRGPEDILAPVLDILDKQEVPKVVILDPVLLELLGPGVMGMEDIRHSHSRVRARDTRVQLQCSPTAICPLVPGREDSCARG